MNGNLDRLKSGTAVRTLQGSRLSIGMQIERGQSKRD